MKTIGYILAAYLLVLSVVPCCIFDKCPDELTEQSSAHEKDDKDCGNCSPFFNCAGCAAATVVCGQIQYIFTVAQSVPVFTNYLQQPLPSAAIDCWQPPKLG